MPTPGLLVSFQYLFYTIIRMDIFLILSGSTNSFYSLLIPKKESEILFQVYYHLFNYKLYVL